MRKYRMILIWLILLLLPLLLGVLSLYVGSVKMTFREMLGLLFSWDLSDTAGTILLKIRFPRVVAAMFLGGALSVSGYLLQTFFANPVAGPYILGISSGAKFVVASLMVFSLGHGFVINSFMMVLAALTGSLLATAIVLLLSSRVNSMAVLIVCGVMIGYICSAATELIVAMADDNHIVNLHNWSLGTFSASSWGESLYYIPIVILCVTAAFLLSKPMEAYLLGEEYVKTLGVPVKLLRVLLILVSSLLSATVTAFAGPVSFVGIAMPHVVRSILRSNDPRIVIPASFLTGASFCLLCDLIARTLFAPTELSISTVTAVFGAPIVISLLLKNSRRKRS